MNKKRIILGLGAFAILGLTLSSCKKIETFTVTFYNGDTEVSSQTVTSGYNALVPDAPTATGKIFNGWYEDEQLTTAFDFGQIIDDNKSVYAAWVNEYSVTFKDGAKTITTQTVVSGYNAKVPTAPTSEGKVFNGWYADAALTTPFNFGSVINENKTIYAAWIDAANNSGSNDNENVTYTVTFDSNGGSDVTAATVAENGKATKPTNPTKQGYNFAGWTLNGEAFDFNTSITGNITLVASWVAVPADALTQTFTFENVTTVDGKDSKGNAKKYVQANYKSKYLTLFASEEKKMELSDAAGDYTTATGSAAKTTKAINTGGGADDETRCVMIDLSAYVGKKAKIQIFASNTGKSNAARTAQLRENALDGTVVFEESYTGTTPIKKEATVNCGKKYYFNTDDSIRIYAINVIELTEDEIEKYTISFETSQGTAPVALQNQTKIDPATLPTFNVTNFKKFDGWTLNGQLISNEVELTGNVTLVAKWSDVSADELATVSYETNLNDVVVESSTVLKNSTVALPAPIKAGYRFVGWYTTAGYQTEFNATTPITKDTILYGKFVVQYTVTFRELDGTTIGTRTVDENGTITDAPSAKFIYGKKFVGWTKNDVDYNLSTAVTGSFDLVAKYEDSDASSIQLMTVQGDQESVYAEFVALEGVTDYNAYVLSSTNNTWVKLDKQLIRLYKGNEYNYYRVDAVGLKAGSYKIRVAGVINNEEQNDTEAISDYVNVIAYDRSGFAFKSNSYNPTGDASGAYNSDGTLKSNARVLYVTKDNAKTVSLDMTVDSKGKTETRTGLQDIIGAYEKGCESRPLAVRIIGKLTASDIDSLGSSSEGLQIKGKTKGTVLNLTVEGIGNDAYIYGFGILVRSCTNVEIRNLGVSTQMDDDISLDTDNLNIWVHDCDLYYGKAGSGDHIKGDGALDVKGTYYCTVSYNHFWDTGKTTLNSNGDDVNYVTYHHNWYDHSDSRHPRVRMSSAVHVYNNYFDGVSKYGIGAAEGGTSIFSENNYFRNTKNPIMSSMQGTDVYAGTSTYSRDNATFSKEDGGIIKSYGDVMTGNYTFIPYGCSTYVCKGTEKAFDLAETTSTVHFDAYVATTRNEVVPDSVVSVQGGTKYSNFDTDSSIMYSYTVQTPEEAVNTIKQYCGRVQGGDLKWTFDNATEDSNYGVISGLRSAIDNYKSNLISVLGIESTGSGSNEPNPTTPDTPTTPDNPTQDLNNDGFTYTMPSTKLASGNHNLASIDDHVVLKYISDGNDKVDKLTYDGKEYTTLIFNGTSNKTSRRFVIDLSSFQSTDTFDLTMIIGAKKDSKVYVIDSSNMGDTTKDASFKTPAEGKYYISFTATDAAQLVTSGTNRLVGGKTYYITCGDKVPLALIKLEKNN